MTSPAPLPGPDETWRQVAARQDQTLGRTQALQTGLTEHAWNWALGKEIWQPILPGVASTHSGEPTNRQRAWAAWIHSGAGAALTGDVALAESGFGIKDLRSVDVAVPWPRRVVDDELLGGPRLLVHTVRRLAPMTLEARPLPVVRPCYAVLHAAAWAATDRAAEWRIAAVVQQRVARASDVRLALADLRRLPRRAFLSCVLDDVEFGAQATSELDFLRFCRRHRLPLPDRMQVKVRANGMRYLDARYDRRKVSMELDGAHHMLVEQWDADALRSLSLVVANKGRGEALIRLTTGNLRHDGPYVARLLRELLT